jgi:tripartite-type tricarboxylate transporter receptor subunit TctC
MTPLLLEVHPKTPAKTAKEFFDLVRSEPGKLTMASPGAGTTTTCSASSCNPSSA